HRISTVRRMIFLLPLLALLFYPIDSVPMSPEDWRRHFGPRWPQFFAAKQAFDPDALLAPGQGIFTAD
ncbi:MAG TPA: hypothetical protein VIJ02_08025, partial [Thermoanaerobaculia bacterium]